MTDKPPRLSSVHKSIIIRADCGAAAFIIIRGATRNRGMPIHDRTPSSKLERSLELKLGTKLEAKLETKLGSEAWDKA